MIAQIYILLFLLYKKFKPLHIKNPVGLEAILWLLPIALCFKGLQAQSYIADVRKLSLEDGLSDRFVNAIHRDNRGFMWIATQNGLNRYDGYEFKPYTKENSPLTSNNIRDIHEDDQQRLWIVNNSPDQWYNIDILIPETSQIHPFKAIFKTTPFAVRNIEQLYSDDKKNMWIITVKGKIYRYNNNRFEHVFSIPDQKAMEIFHADTEFLWLYRDAVLKSDIKFMGVNTRDSTIKRYHPKEKVRMVGMDKNNTLWLYQPYIRTVVQAHREKQTLKPIDLKHLQLPDLGYHFTNIRIRYLNPVDDLIWWFTEDIRTFFYVFHPRKGLVYNFQDKVASLLSYNRPGKRPPQVTDAYFDTEGRVWVATHDGILIVNLNKNKFRTLTSDTYKTYSARGITQDKQGRLHVNTHYTRIQIDPETGALKGTMHLKYGGFGATMDHQGHLWLTRQDHVIKKYTLPEGKIQYYTYPKDASRDAPEQQWAILCDTKGQIWTGTRRGVYTLEPETGRYRKFTQYNAFPQLGESTVYHLHEDNTGIWVASSSGLYLLEPGKGITTRYAKTEDTPYHIPYQHVLHFHRDKENILWLATQGGGLIRLNPHNGAYQQFTTTEGLSSNTLYAVYEDDYGKLWLSSNYGLMQFDKHTHTVNTYLTGDGIAHEEFNTASHYQAADGHLYFGGLAGVTAFHPKDFTTETPTTAPLRMTNCRVLHKKTGTLTDKTRAITNSGRLELAPSENSFILTFALLNYENSRKNSYAYTIEGLDKEWTTIQENRLRINALPYGSYTLYIKGQGIQGVQAANQLAIPIVVHAPFYRKNWFIAISVFTLGILLSGVFYWRLRRLKKTKIRLEATVRQRTQEISSQKTKIEQQAKKLEDLNVTQSRWFNNIAHELRTPLTLIHGPTRRFLKKYPDTFGEDTRDIQMVEKNTRSLLKLVNEILDISRLDSDQLKLNKTAVSLSLLIRETVAQFESIAWHKGVTLTSHIPGDLKLHIDKDRIRNILVNLISNALKFTHAGGKVTISLQHEAEKGVTITVADTGDGIPEKDLPYIFERYFQVSDPNRINLGGAGIGLSLALELARLHGGDLTAESRLGVGSVFTLTLPQSLVLDTPKPVIMPVAVTIPEALANTMAPSFTDKQHKPLVLLVEDHPDMRQYIRSFMDKHYRVAEAGDGLEALDYLKKHTPELIISDIMMPRMDGIALAKTLKTDENLKHLPFITLTARTGESDKIAALRIGIDDYLTKPFNPEELEARAFNLIRNYNQRKAISQKNTEEIIPPGHQDKFIAATKAFVMEQLQNNTLSVSDLAHFHNMSSSSLNRLTKKASGLSPGQFIREVRLQQARKLLETRQYSTVLEVVYAVGFEKASYFAKVFTERFGKKPSEYL